MISSQKYRINSLAKDLGLKSKQLAGILPGGDAGITHQLSPDEFGYVIDTLTASAHEVSIDDYIGGKLDLDLPARKTAAEKPAKSDDKASDKSGSREHKSGAEQKVEQNNDKSQQKKSDAERAKERERAKAAAEKAAEKRVQHGQSERMQQLREAPRPDAIAAKANSKMKQNLMRQNQQRQQKLTQQN